MTSIALDALTQLVITSLISVASIITAIAIYLRQRKRKRITYHIVSIPLIQTDSLFDDDPELKPRLKILFDGKPVPNLTLVGVTILNAGNTEIVPEDYEQPLTIAFNDGADIFTANRLSRTTESVHVSASIENSQVILKPILLNAGERIGVGMIVGRFSGAGIKGHIKGVKRIDPVESTIRTRFLDIITKVGAFAIGGLGIVTFYWILGYTLVNFVPRPTLSEIPSQVIGALFIYPLWLLFFLGDLCRYFKVKWRSKRGAGIMILIFALAIAAAYVFDFVQSILPGV
ncbi:MAG: hypothetical protein ABSE39_03735 [Candidatus Bathyarchaeia archaeon]